MPQKARTITKTANGLASNLQLSLLVDMNSPFRVLEEVKFLFLDMFNKGDFTYISTTFEDVVALFAGSLPGFKACDTPYHNLKHTTDVFLAMARLIHGAFYDGKVFDESDVCTGLMAALMHDVGYIQKDSETNGSGSVLSSVHVKRSIEFMHQYLSKRGFSQKLIRRSETMILFTELNHFQLHYRESNSDDGKLAQMIGAADLLAQTADRNYLEKLRMLFLELQTAGDTRYDSELSLITAAPQFDQFMRRRLASELDGIDRYLQPHFKFRWGIDLNMYQEAIDRTLAYLADILRTKDTNVRSRLRRIVGT